MKKSNIFCFAFFIMLLTSCSKDDNGNNDNNISDAYQVSTLAGNGKEGYVDGAGNAAQFKSLFDIEADAQGNIYVADGINYVIRKITPTGDVSTLAGSGVSGIANGLGRNAQFAYPTRIAIDVQGNLYVVDNYSIRKITPAGLVTTFAGGEIKGSVNGTGADARFYTMNSITVDRLGNVFVLENGIPEGGILKMRKITPAGIVSTFHEDNILSISLTTDKENNIYMAGSFYNGSIYRYTPDGVKSTVKEMEGFLSTLLRDEQGNFYYTESGPFNFSNKQQVFKLSSEGEITVIAGTGVGGYEDGNAKTARFDIPGDLTMDVQGNLYVADIKNLRIRKLSKK